MAAAAAAIVAVSAVASAAATAAAIAVVADAVATEALPKSTIDLASMATSIGQAWAEECVSTLRAQERDIVGAWPGTIREARRRMLARAPIKLETDKLDELARMVNLAARRGWDAISEPDLEP